MRYILDTNIFIAAMKGVDSVRARLEKTPLSAVILSPIVLGELELGVEKSASKEKNAARLKSAIEQIELIPIDEKVSRLYSIVRADLEIKGIAIGSNDYWIAAQGLALNAVVVTDNTKEFERVPNLVTENWLV